MAVSENDVRHVATLARLGIDEARIPSLVRELNGILVHMEALSKIDTTSVHPAEGVSSGGMWLRKDEGPPVPLAVARDAFAPEIRDGFFVVPRLSSHAEAAADDLDADDLAQGTGEVLAAAELSGDRVRKDDGT